jgi:mannitol-1-/sugar-/sorbitol-6-/2-deoxyglucose-6-phosphatase
MDGLLIDSEILWHKAEVEILGDLGVPLTAQGTRTTKGMVVDEVVAHWYAQYPWSGPSISEITDRIVARVGDLVENEGRLLPGATRALDLTSARGPIALASSTPRGLIERCLAPFGLRSRFAVITSAAEEEFGKPHPAVFLSAAAQLHVDPRQCLVFEDAPAGVIAATAARMSCIAVPDGAERGRPEFGLADLVLGSLDELSEAWLAARYSPRRGTAVAVDDVHA